MRVLVAGLGNMGRSHALAWAAEPGAELVGLVNRSPVSLRSAVELDVMVSSPHNSVCYDAILGNLSASGGLFELPQLCAARGDKIHLTLSLPETGSMPLTAEVRNLHTSNNNGIPVIQYGIEFCDLAATEHALLEHFIFKSLLDSEL